MTEIPAPWNLSRNRISFNISNVDISYMEYIYINAQSWKIYRELLSILSFKSIKRVDLGLEKTGINLALQKRGKKKNQLKSRGHKIINDLQGDDVQLTVQELIYIWLRLYLSYMGLLSNFIVTIVSVPHGLSTINRLAMRWCPRAYIHMIKIVLRNT
jgi:hypothetical protein